MPAALPELLKIVRLPPAKRLIVPMGATNPRPSLKLIPMLVALPLVLKTAMSPAPGPPWPAEGVQLFPLRHASPPPPEPPDQVWVAACPWMTAPSEHTNIAIVTFPVIFTAPRCGSVSARDTG